MRKARRITAVLLALVTLVLLAAPVSALSLEAIMGDDSGFLPDDAVLPAVTGLSISTGKKENQLVLRWNNIPDAFGYEIWRSATGKTGSYKMITAEGGTSYTDAGLKASTTYYYAVRPWAWTKSKETVFGPFKKVNLSTRITKGYAVTRYTQAYKAMAKFQNAYDGSDAGWSKAVEATREGWYGFYLPFTLKGCKTKNDAVKYLSKYIEKKAAKGVANYFLKTINGKLYIWKAQDPGSSETLLINDVSVRKATFADKKVVCKYDAWFAGFNDDASYYYTTKYTIKLALIYQRGKWVFADDDYWYCLDYDYTSKI